MMKSFVRKKLEKLVKQYFLTHQDIKLVAVVGSVGKTSAKIAIATVLSEKFRVRVHGGDHNTEMSAPLAILGIKYPEKNGIFDWLNVLNQAKQKVKSPSDVDVIVQELGTDGIGQIPAFGKYLRPDVSVLTAISAEHMQYFRTIENVAKEEMSISNFTKFLIVNSDDVSKDWHVYNTNPNTSYYGTGEGVDYRFIFQSYNFQEGYKGSLTAPEMTSQFAVSINLLGEHTIHSAIAAGAVAAKLGMTDREIASGISRIKSVPGRMNILQGAENTIIIDDTYNSSPLATKASIEAVYRLPVTDRIVVLGNMNELGDLSSKEHEAIGNMCDPSKLSWVVTVGQDAEKYLAPAAKANGCQVKSCTNALEAGAFVRSILKSGSVILFKGSQDKVFLEEAIKIILHKTSDEVYLVRQTSEWIQKKNNYFSKFK